VSYPVDMTNQTKKIFTIDDFRNWGAKGGKAAAKTRSKKDRVAIAKKASSARWNKDKTASKKAKGV